MRRSEKAALIALLSLCGFLLLWVSDLLHRHGATQPADGWAEATAFAAVGFLFLAWLATWLIDAISQPED